MDVSFSGAGFMGCYYFGVVNCLNKYIPRDRVRRSAGASAGALSAAYYLLELPLDTCLKSIIEMTEDVRSRPLGVFDRSNQIVDVLPRVLDKLFPADAHKRVSGRLFVSMTRLRDMKNVMVNQFDTKKDLIDALNCSCFIPVWSGNHVATYRGVKHIDGGFTNNLPVFDEHTIRVCCFSGAADIAPYDRAQLLKFMGQGNAMGLPFNLTWKNLKRGGRALWPPPPSYIVELLERGFHDTKAFVLSNDLIQCSRCFDSGHLHLAQDESNGAGAGAGVGAGATRNHRGLGAGGSTPAISPAISRAGSSLNLSELHRASSFRIKLNANGQPEQEAEAGAQTPEKAPDRAPASRVHIKQHRQAELPPTVALFEQDRSKSGKTIKRKCLERSQSELYAPKAPGGELAARVSFATKLRDKLQRVASSSRLLPESGASDTKPDAKRGAEPPVPSMPTIVIEELASECEPELGAEACADAEPETRAAVAQVGQEKEEPAQLLQRRQRPQTPREFQTTLAGRRRQQRTMSVCSSGGSSTATSNDSALGLEAPASPAGKPVTGSPAEKFFASSAAASRRRAASLATGELQLNAEQRARLERAIESSGLLAPATFNSAPSPLPSCPPSPNLNRHCTECIRLRQQARLDGIDDVVKREAELYGGLKSDEPPREFSSFKGRVACWLRQLATARYSYSFDAQCALDEPETKEADGAPSPGSVRARAKARATSGAGVRLGPRRGSLVGVITPASEIPSHDL